MPEPIAPAQPLPATEPVPRKALKAGALMPASMVVYLYRRRLRVHGVQELLAGLGVAIAVALVFAAMIANGSVAGSASEVVHQVVGPANLQLHARGLALDELHLALEGIANGWR